MFDVMSGRFLKAAATGESGARRWFNIAAWIAAFSFLSAAAVAVIVLYSRHNPVDFLSYWAAGKLALDGHAALAYDIAVHKSVEQAAAPIAGLLPFPYPPLFLLFVSPFGLLPFWISFPAWIAVTGIAYVLAVRRFCPLPYALAHPSVLSNSLIGQNAFLTSAIFIGGAELLARRPYIAGAILGLLVMKPQLAILLPVAMLAGREWKAIFAASVSVSASLLFALVIFGPAAYQGFFQILPLYAEAMQASRWPWGEIASTFALLRKLGIAETTALIVHGIVALGAAVVTARAWWLRLDERVPILASAAMLIPPYVFTYDGLLLVSPLTFLITRGHQLWASTIVWLLCLLPVAGYFGFYSGPNTVPVAALITLWALHRPIRSPATEDSSVSLMPPVPSTAHEGGSGRLPTPRP
jgi:hypothetical protein